MFCITFGVSFSYADQYESTQQFVLSLVTNYDGNLQSYMANNELFSIPFQIFYVNGKNILTLGEFIPHAMYLYLLLTFST